MDRVTDMLVRITEEEQPFRYCASFPAVNAELIGYGYTRAEAVADCERLVADWAAGQLATGADLAARDLDGGAA